MPLPAPSTPQAMLQGLPVVINAATAPLWGGINGYIAATGPLAPPLPPLAASNPNANLMVEKSALDLTLNPITFTPAGTDAFDDGSPSLILTRPGQKRLLQVIRPTGPQGTPLWKVVGGLDPPAGIIATVAQVSLTNTGALTTLLSTALTPGLLFAGSSYKITVDGTAQVTSASGTLTFTPNIQGTALAQTAVMPTQTSAAGPVGFHLEYEFTVQTTGTTGTAIAAPFGLINFATPVYLMSTSSAATTINTTAAAGSNVLSLQAQWQTANAANSLLVNIATIERKI